MDTLKIISTDWEVLKHNKAIIDKWIIGLRSGKWMQTTGNMTNPNVPNSACCLMVLEAECNNKVTTNYVTVYNQDQLGSIAGLPTERENPLKLQLQGPGLKYPQNIYAIFKCNSGVKRLQQFDNSRLVPSQWNDVLGLSFEEIATLLETGSLTKDFSV
jgi:hypothetical protein